MASETNRKNEQETPEESSGEGKWFQKEAGAPVGIESLEKRWENTNAINWTNSLLNAFPV